jgi:hypothetical protein
MPFIKTPNGAEYEVRITLPEVQLVEKTPPGPLSMTPQEERFVADRIEKTIAPQVLQLFERLFDDINAMAEEEQKPEIIV